MKARTVHAGLFPRKEANPALKVWATTTRRTAYGKRTTPIVFRNLRPGHDVGLIAVLRVETTIGDEFVRTSKGILGFPCHVLAS